MNFFQSQIVNLSNECLEKILKDAMNRIGSHVGMSEEPNEDYVTKQQSIISMVKDELERRQKVCQ